MRLTRISSVVLAALACASSALAEGPRPGKACTALLAENLPRLLELPPQEFEFDKATGYRLLSREGCHAEAAEAIATYIRRHELPSHIYFHAAQEYAKAGDYAHALGMIEKSYIPASEDNPFKWNAYVRGVKAFLEHDKPALEREREVLRSRSDVRGNAVNLKVLDKLLERFDQTYLQALQ